MLKFQPITILDCKAVIELDFIYLGGKTLMLEIVRKKYAWIQINESISRLMIMIITYCD